MLKTSRGGGKTLTYLLAGVFAFATGGAWAANRYWTGGGSDTLWNTAGNWDSLPGSSDSLFFRTESPNNKTVTLNGLYSYSGYMHLGLGGSADEPYIFEADAADHGLTIQDDVWLGYYEDGGLWLKSGTYTFGTKSGKSLHIGEAKSGSHDFVLRVGDGTSDVTLNAGNSVYVCGGGGLIADNAKMTVAGSLGIGALQNDNAFVAKTGGDWVVNGNISMNGGSGSKAIFRHYGGNLVVANDLCVQDRGSGEFYMEGGHVTVSNRVSFGQYYLSSGNKANVYLNGGVFEAKAFRFHNCDYSTASFIFNGGTYKAMADGHIAVYEGRMGYGYLRFKVGAQGGTIDTAGYDVVSPFQLLKDGSVSGPLTVKGGGSLALSNSNITYDNKIFLEAGTTLAVSNDTAAANILARGIELTGTPEFNKGYTVFVCNKELAESDLDNITCSVAEIAKSIGADGKSIVVTYTGDKDLSAFVPRYIGPADGSLSDAANWTPAGIPASGNVYIKSETAANLTVGDTFSPSAITFLPGSASVTIGGNDLANIEAVTNLSSAVQMFANKVAFKDAYRIYCDGYAVNFAGGATATCPAGDMVDNAVSHVLMGDITFTANWAQGDIVNPYTVPNGSVLQGEDARGTGTTSSHCFLSIEPGGKAYFKTAFVSHNKSLINTDGELHVKDVLEVGDGESTANSHATHDENDIGVIYAGGLHKCARRNVYIKVPALYIGSQGLGANAQDYTIRFADAAKTVYATADFKIFGPTNNSTKSDWGLSLDKQVTFNTQGHTITWTGGANGSGALVKDGEGTLVFDPPGTGLSGAVTVKGGTLKVMSASGVSTGTMTVEAGAVLEVVEGGSLGTSPLTLEAGSTLVVPSSGLPLAVASLALPESGKATIRIAGDAAYAEGDYELLFVTGGLPAGFADKVDIVLPDGTSENRQLYTIDNGIMRFVVGDAELSNPYTWTGAAGDGKMNTPGNWLGGEVPPEGSVVFIPPTAGEIENDIENFAPASITIGYGGGLEIGGNDIVNVVAITNLSTVASQTNTINAKVYFAGNIQVKQAAMAETGDLTKAHVTFAGGAYAAPGCSLENGNYAANYSRCMFGKYYLASTAENPWTVPYQGGSKRICLADDSSLYIPYAGALTELYVGTGAKVDVGDMSNVSGRISYQNKGEMVVTNLTVTGGDTYLTYNQGTTVSSVFKFGSVTNKISNAAWLYLGDGNASSKQTIFFGEGGIGFKGSGTTSICFGNRNKADTQTTIRPWYSDFTIGGKSNSSTRAIAFDNAVVFNTDDEEGEGRKITLDAITYARNSATITVSGTGTLQVNKSMENGVQPAVTVSDSATLAFGANGSLGTGDITLGAGTTLALTAASSRSEPLIDNTLNLPTEGKAKLRIDGVRLRSGNHEIATLGTGTAENIELDENSEALAGRKATFSVDSENNLILTIKPSGTLIIIR